MPNCNTSNLSEFTPTTDNIWDKKKVQHVYRRLGFGTSSANITSVLSETPSTFIDNLITDAISLGPMTTPSWANMAQSDYSDFDVEVRVQHKEMYLHFENDMLTQNLRGRFTMFWHNHFVTRLEDYWCPSWQFEYYKTLHTYGFGNFKEFVRAIGINPAMIVFLNAYQNTATEPNENYAREFYELFTLGVNNGYTQTDIVETARAFTGYTGYTEFCAPITFNSSDFDTNNKTIFGQTGNWDYDDVIDILFMQKGALIANYVCTKLYTYFVSPEINETIISELATTLVNNNFELAPLYRQLFKSNHFFDENAIGAIVKSPFDMFNTFIIESGLPISDEIKESIIWFNGEVGQDLYNPIDVAGWQGNHDWINSSTLVGRWRVFEYYLWKVWEADNTSYRTFALTLTSITETDPALITRTIVDHFIANGFQNEAAYAVATDVFKDEVPQNYYDNNLWNLGWDSALYQVYALLLHISKQPDFQLK